MALMHATSRLFDDSLFDDVFGNPWVSMPRGFFWPLQQLHTPPATPNQDAKGNLEPQAERGMGRQLQMMGACDVREEADHYSLHIDTPGMSEEDISIELTGDHALAVSGKRSRRVETKGPALPATTKTDAITDGAGDVMDTDAEPVPRKPAADQQKDATVAAPRWHRVERSFGSFQRTFNLPEDANVDNITASMHNGELVVTVPKLPTPQPKTRKIQVQKQA
ncbi:uncharacterized protein MONBRDRAFT_34249 [Monosiga brevicollis MX1]|uniref:SHSP domain-containing protein n=1 Tax=Monosiga brevicollis TaxID=81824 RepID=A9VAH3_MONBE|nr:uncharacterized protein MONBRDRAFT_34249 [Monosiga brevicollis MX1]EDQ85486.1 predicted protein [Monosiga brevicollis MX1]|eukprot:XP_001749677.1 hypothetical protein [Monosiga brevicollis MX1]